MKNSASNSLKHGTVAGTLLKQRLAMTLGLVAVWLLLTDASAASLIVGVPFILLAVLAIPASVDDSHRAGSFRLSHLPAFLWQFSIESLRGGIDVSRRVLARQPRLDPGYFDYDMQLQSANARQLLISCISLLPGTLCALWQDDRLRIHALDVRHQTDADIRKLEDSVARLFGETK